MRLNFPVLVAVGSAIAGAALFVAGIYVLAGLGWAMLAGAAPLVALSTVLVRGLINVTG